MRFIRTGSLCAYASSLVLASCASSAAGTAGEVTESPPVQRSAAPAPPAKKPLSPYERRWASACTQPGSLGRCPAPFDRPGVFFDANGNDQYAPPALCGVIEQTTDRATGAALELERKALRACVRGAEHGAWVDVVSDGSRPVNASAGLPPRIASCVAKVVQGALPSSGASGSQRVVVLSIGSRGGAATLSNERVRAMISAHADEVGACYDAALAVWPGLRGRMAPSVVIWFDGSVASVHTEQSSLDNPALECCINTAVRSWHFDPPEDGNIAIVSLPFVLGPQP